MKKSGRSRAASSSGPKRITCGSTRHLPQSSHWTHRTVSTTTLGRFRGAVSGAGARAFVFGAGVCGFVVFFFDGGVCGWVSKNSPGGSNSAEWVAFDTMRTVTVTKIRVAAGSLEGSPRNFKLQSSSSLDGAWKDVLDISDAARTTDSMEYELNKDSTSRFWRLLVSFYTRIHEIYRIVFIFLEYSNFPFIFLTNPACS
mgnify:CR=1 FL=1